MDSLGQIINKRIKGHRLKLLMKITNSIVKQTPCKVNAGFAASQYASTLRVQEGAHSSTFLEAPGVHMHI